MTRVVTAVLPLALGVLLSSACRSAPGEGAPSAGAGDQPLAAADLAAIRATDSAFASAAGAGDAAGVAANYLPDAQLMPPNAPTVEGREAIQKFWGGLLGAYQLRFQVVADEVEGRGDLAYARGHYTLDGTPKAKGGAPIHDEGKYLEVLRRQPDGGWRYAVDMYSSNLPAPGAK
jgi:uncharacterized protein (TIGR02246 family)